jgi:hypothetical protein
MLSEWETNLRVMTTSRLPFVFCLGWNSNALASLWFFCTILLIDGTDMRIHLGFDQHQHDLDFSDDENIPGGK